MNIYDITLATAAAVPIGGFIFAAAVVLFRRIRRLP
jgi:hypothetical protein